MSSFVASDIETKGRVSCGQDVRTVRKRIRRGAIRVNVFHRKRKQKDKETMEKWRRRRNIGQIVATVLLLAGFSLSLTAFLMALNLGEEDTNALESQKKWR